MLLTFTPLLGLSDVVLSFLPGGKPRDGIMSGSADSNSGKWYTVASTIETPHISAAEREKSAADFMSLEREARTRGIPSLGGAIFPVPESDITVKPFELPPYYRHAYGLDVGWNRTAAIWGALDPETDVLTSTASITAARLNQRYTRRQSGLEARGSPAWLILPPAAAIVRVRYTGVLKRALLVPLLGSQLGKTESIQRASIGERNFPLLGTALLPHEVIEKLLRVGSSVKRDIVGHRPGLFHRSKVGSCEIR
jgi:hypothetical protein